MSNYLFHYKYKKIGWIIFIPSLVLGLIVTITGFEPGLLDISVPAFFTNPILGDKTFFRLTNNNIIDELICTLIIIGGILSAFSKEKIEDEYISKIRLESLVWATYFNYGILLIAILFIYDMSFVWVMIINLFTLLIFFSVRFNWKLHSLKTSNTHD